MLKLLITGADGRMGKTLIAALNDFPDCRLVAAVTEAGSAHLEQDAGLVAGCAEAGVSITADLDRAAKTADIIVDFTVPEVTVRTTELCVQQGLPLVTGTTGLNKAQQKTLAKAAGQTAIVQAPNFSPGVYWMEVLIRQIATLNADAPELLDVEIFEVHHRQKIDAPSGTALHLGQVAADALGRDFDKNAPLNHQAAQGAKAKEAIGFACTRSGDAVGEHKITFAVPGESLHITHQAFSRHAFARGALQAAVWVSRQKSGLYGMRDVMTG